MISVDTSVVVRYLVGTPVDQARRAARLLDAERQVGISILVLAETAHVLRSFYRIPRPDIVTQLIELVTKANIVPIEVAKPEILEALVRARSYQSAPITDALIAASARAADAQPVYTFDRDFGRLGATVATP